MPYWSVWVFAAGLALAILVGGFRNGNMLLLGMVALYLLNGIAIVRLFFEQPGRSKISEALFFLMQVWLFCVPLFFLGLLEHWIDLRSRIVKAEQLIKK
jgi:hypothetical protein